MSRTRQLRLGEPARADSGVDGQLKAAGALGRTVLNPDVQRVLDDYRRLNTPEARARYADHFLGRTAHVMDDIWPAFYELLKQVEEGELYKQPGYVGGDRTFESFKDYFEYRAGRPFKTWADMEATYHFARDHARELFEVALDKAISLAQKAQQLANALKQAKDECGLVINESPGPLPAAAKANRDIISIKQGSSGGTGSGYLARRIARDRPDILSRMAAGEYRSIRAAALDAGIAPRTQSVRMDDPESAARTLRKHMEPGVLAELVRILTGKEN